MSNLRVTLAKTDTRELVADQSRLCLPLDEAGLNQRLETGSQCMISCYMGRFFDAGSLQDLESIVPGGVTLILCAMRQLRAVKHLSQLLFPVAGLSVVPKQPTKFQTNMKWQPPDHLLSFPLSRLLGFRKVRPCVTQKGGFQVCFASVCW